MTSRILPFDPHFAAQLGANRAIVRMQPADFLRLANPETPVSVTDPLDLSLVLHWPEWPALELAPESGEVFWYQGARRMTRLLRAGYTSVDVLWLLMPDPASCLPFEDAMAWRWSRSLPAISALKPRQSWRVAIRSLSQPRFDTTEDGEHCTAHSATLSDHCIPYPPR